MPIIKIIRIIIILSVMVAFPVISSADTDKTPLSILKKYIIEYNLKTLEKNRMDGSCRGEQGILMIRPDIAESFGMKVVSDEDYLESKRLFKEAKDLLKKVTKTLASRGSKLSSDHQARNILDDYLQYRNKMDSAKKKLADHLSRIDPNEDERLNNSICEDVLDRLLAESLIKTNNRLRDGLGYFFNICRETTDQGYSLTSENIRFVNHVYNGFLKDASEDDLKNFDLDMDTGYYNSSGEDKWKEIIKKDLADFIPIIEAEINKTADQIYRVDPLLFISLMKRESAFNPCAVSSVGAAGLTQIMPVTGRDLGLKNIYMPEYFDEATSLLKKERDLRSQVNAELMKIKENSDLPHAKKAYNLMQKSLDLGDRRKKLFDKYKSELLKDKTDDRLQPANAIKYGLLYFAELLKKQNGDISLALASYNAGPHRVREYGGIPPFDETVGFRNAVLKYYRDYLEMMETRDN